MPHYKIGDYLQIVHNCVVQEINEKGYLTVKDLDRKFRFGIEGNELIDSTYSSSYVEHEAKVSRTELIDMILLSNGKIFSCGFVKANGEERVMHAKLLRPETKLGRSMVACLDENMSIKQIDHRTLDWVIINSIKYVKK